MSGDDRKGRFDWLSQIGFRDPATGFSARPHSRDDRECHLFRNDEIILFCTTSLLNLIN